MSTDKPAALSAEERAQFFQDKATEMRAAGGSFNCAIAHFFDRAAQDIEAAAVQARAEEREACAQIVMRTAGDRWMNPQAACCAAATAIRARAKAEGD